MQRPSPTTSEPKPTVPPRSRPGTPAGSGQNTPAEPDTAESEQRKRNTGLLRSVFGAFMPRRRDA
jgi:hypothetical protein